MRILILILTLVLSTVVYSQNFKYGKVSDEEVMEKVHPLEPTANAAVLFKSESVSFIVTPDGFSQLRDVHERIKIYNKEGFDWATKRVALYKADSGTKEILSKINGVTYNLSGNKITKDKLTKDGVFDEDANEYIRISTLTLPNIQEGSVIEYSYTIESPFLAIDDVVLQYEIPINKMEIRIATPEYFRYSKSFNPKAKYIANINESQESKTVTSQGKSRKIDSSTGNYFGTTNQSTSSTTYYEYIVSLNESNIPALKNEELISSLNNYRAKLGMELSAIQRSGGVFETLSTSWEMVCNSIYNSPNFGDQLKRSNFYDDDLKAVAGDISDPFAKAFILQNFVRSKVKWNGLYGYSTSKGTRAAYKDGSGNVADINLLLISMLQATGVHAYPVLISTRNNGIPLFPTRNGFNYVVCMVETDEGYALFDATENFSSFNVLPMRALNWQGRVLRPDGSSSWVNLIPKKSSAETTSLNVKINDDLSAEGTLRKRLTDHLAFNYRNKYAFSSEEDHIKALETDKGDLEISDLNFDNAKDVTKPVELNFKYELQDAVEGIGDKLYLQPMFFTAMKETPFKSDARLYSIDFAYPVSEKYLINIALPEGYVIETLPKSEALNFKDEACVFSYVAQNNGKYLQLNINLDIKTTIIDTADYQAFKDFFQRIIEKQAERVVLTKA